MIRASALYMVIIIALVIAVLCSAVIVAGYFYRAQYQSSFRNSKLQLNLASATNILLADTANTYQEESTFGLFNEADDSVSVQRKPWGIFDVGIAKAFKQGDTVYNAFTIADAIDTAKWVALYVPDEDRPLSVSGKAFIRGTASIPKAGIREAYVDGNGYEGDKHLVIGRITNSGRELPPLNPKRLKLLDNTTDLAIKANTWVPREDSIKNSFLQPVRYLYLGKNAATLHDIDIEGNIIISSDTTLTIDASTSLRNVIIRAPGIVINSGFHGNAQFFATDSISVGERCVFDYPSCLAVLKRSPLEKGRALISIGNHTVVNGTVAAWQEFKASLLPLIKMGDNVSVKGQVYSLGIVSYKNNNLVYGSIFTGRFLYQNNFSAYENYLIGNTVDAKKLSPYYLSSMLLPSMSSKNKVLQWLERK